MVTVLGCFGSRTRWCLLGQVGVIEDCRVAQGRSDGEPEEGADASDISAGGMDFVEDPVGPDIARCRAEDESWQSVADGRGPQSAAEVDEYVRVGRVRPAAVAVVEVGSQPNKNGFGEQDRASVEDKSTIVDVGEVQRAQLAGAQAVECQQCGHRGAG